MAYVLQKQGQTHMVQLPAEYPSKKRLPHSYRGTAHLISRTRTCPSAVPTAATLEEGAKSTVNTGFGKFTRAPKAVVFAPLNPQ
mmetsp:Transcript_49877/g.112259  ORF Transcript_49877/g.112259 Transcript_49877/m.112259 type:complete len:84 (-) Transcript_49877:1030-1281(-)